MAASLRDDLLRIGKESHAENLAFLQAEGSKRAVEPPTTDIGWISVGIFDIANAILYKLLQRLPGWMTRTADETSVALSCALAICTTSFLHIEVLGNEPERSDLLDQSITALFSGFKIIYPEVALRGLVETSITLNRDLLHANHPTAAETREHLGQLFLLYPINRITKKRPEEEIDKALFLIYDSLRKVI